MEFNAVRINARLYKKEILKKHSDIIDSGIFLSGKEVKKLESKLSSILENQKVLCVASGQDALMLSLNSLKLTYKDSIVIQNNSYPSGFGIFGCSAKLILVDTDSNGQMDLQDLTKKIEQSTKVVVLTHLYGGTTDVQKIVSFCKKRKILLIEDCAQSLGTYFKGRPTGVWGDIGCFSFYPSKNIGSYGNGGAVTLKSKKLYSYVSMGRSYGEKDRYKSEFISTHSRLSELQAAGLRIHLKYLASIKKRRQKLDVLFQKRIAEKLERYGLSVLKSHPLSNICRHLFVISAPRRDKLRAFLVSKGIPALVHYPKTLSKTKAFEVYHSKNADCPVSESLTASILSLPFHEHLKAKDIDIIVSAINRFYEKKP